MPYKVERTEKGDYAVIYFLPYDPDGSCDYEWFSTLAQAEQRAAALNEIERKMDMVFKEASTEPDTTLDLMES